MNNQSVPRAKRQPSVRIDAIPTNDRGRPCVEALESRTLLSAGDWRIATGLTRTTMPVQFNAAGRDETAASLGSTAFFAGFSQSDSFAAYDAVTGRWTALQPPPTEGFGTLAAAGHTVLFAGDHERVHLYDTQTHQTSVHTLAGYTGDKLTPAATTVDGLVIFETGDIFNSVTGQWSQTTSLEQQNYFPDSATSVGHLAIFAGGTTTTDHSHYQPSDNVRIYDIFSGQWSSAQLIAPRFGMAATSVGDLAFFAGGGFDAGTTNDAVDMYNARTGQWSVARLSVSRNSLAATSVGNLALFGGGNDEQGGSNSSVVDVYDAATGRWFTTALSVGRSGIAAATAAGKALFAGGLQAVYGSPDTSPQVMDIFTPVPGVTGSISGKPLGEVNLTVQTNGDAALPPGAIISLYASPDGTLAGATPIGTATLPSGLAAQSSTKLSIRTSLASVPSGRYWLVAAADDSSGQGSVVIASQPKVFKIHARAPRKALIDIASRFRGLFAR